MDKKREGLMRSMTTSSISPERWNNAAPAPAHSVEHLLDTLSMPIWVVRVDARIDFANAAARKAMDEGQWAQVRATSLVGVANVDELALRSAISQHPRNGLASSLVLVFKQNGYRLRGRLHIAPLRGTAIKLCEDVWPHASALLSVDLPPGGHPNSPTYGHLKLPHLS